MKFPTPPTTLHTHLQHKNKQFKNDHNPTDAQIKLRKQAKPSQAKNKWLKSKSQPNKNRTEKWLLLHDTCENTQSRRESNLKN